MSYGTGTQVVEAQALRSRGGDDPPPGPLTLGLWALGGLFSLVGFWLIVRDSRGGFPWLGCLCHLVSTALVVTGTVLAKGIAHPASPGWGALMGFFSLFAGPLGYFTGILCYLFGIGQPTEMPLVDVVKAEMWIRPMQLDKADEIIPFEVLLREELRTQPIVDLLPFADVPTALAIINRLADGRKSDDVRLLRHLTQDRRPEVYQYALSKVDELEKEYATRIFAIKEQLKYRPNDPALRVELAKLYLDYTDSGLLDGSLQDYYWELTLAQLLEAMRSQPSNHDLRVDLGRLFLAKKLYAEARLVVEEALRREPGNLRGQLLMLECLTEQGQVERRPDLIVEARRRSLENAWAVRLPSRKTENLPMYSVAHFWFGRHRGKKNA